MPNTEIDEIFASKSKHSQVETAPLNRKEKAKASLGSREDTNMSGEKKKKKKKKIKSTINEDDNDSVKPSLPVDEASAKRKRPEPETIIDPSVSVPTAKKKRTVGVAGVEESSSRTTKKKVTDPDGFEKFRDSRGTGPRRKTEEGFSIYKEDELGIGDRGGDTSLCPFDCDCCF